MLAALDGLGTHPILGADGHGHLAYGLALVLVPIGALEAHHPLVVPVPESDKREEEHMRPTMDRRSASEEAAVGTKVKREREP